MLEVEIYKELPGFSLSVKFRAQPGEILGVLGASGCGKSMTLKCIAGIERPDRGRIVLQNRVLFDAQQGINLSPQERRVGYLFQSYALFPHMTVAENIAAGIRMKKQRSALVASYLQMFYLQDLADRLPKALSGGQQQRVALARMFASAPDVLLLDEPFSALDSYLKWQVGLELQKVLETCRKPVLFVSHSRDEVYEFCDRIAVLNDGHLEHVAEKKALFCSPKTLAASKLTGCKNHSRIRRLHAHRVAAEDWGLELDTQQVVAEDAVYAGIRAHDVQIAVNQTKAGNVRCFHVRRVLEEPFSIVLMVQAASGKAMLRVEMEKAVWQQVENKADLYLVLPPDKIFLLRG